jgi:hypothetical protein
VWFEVANVAFFSQFNSVIEARATLRIEKILCSKSQVRFKSPESNCKQTEGRSVPLSTVFHRLADEQERSGSTAKEGLCPSRQKQTDILSSIYVNEGR